MDDIKRARRRFLKSGLAFASLPLGGVPFALGQSGHSGEPETDLDKLKAYGERSRFVTSKRIEYDPGQKKFTNPPYGLTAHLETPLQDLVGTITPNSLWFSAGHEGFYVPDINPNEHRLMIHGMVEHPLMFTMDELMRLPSMSRIHYLECNGNYPFKSFKTVQEAAGRTSCAEWTGVPLSLLLKEAGLKDGATWLIAEGAEDNHNSLSIPIERAMNGYCMLAYGQNGEPLRPQNGYPMRLLVPGLEALNSIKWIRRIEITDQHYMGYMQHSRYLADPKVVQTNWVQGPKSIITSPSGGQQLPGPGHYEITGLAWSGAGAVRKVEISTDCGQTWKDAEFRSIVLPMAHTRFGMSWNWDGQAYVLMSRCTDEKGQVQPTQAEFNKMWPAGVLGQSHFFTHPNFIIPWALGRDGRLENGLS